MPATLTQIRQMAGEMLGRYYAGTANATGNGIQTLVDTQLMSNIEQNELWQDFWLCLPTASGDDRLSRQVQSFAANNGTLGVNRAWSGATVPDGKAYELHGHIEPITDLTAAINATLKRLTVVVEITLTPTPDAIRHDLTTANPWLTSRNAVRQVGWLVTNETRAQTDPFRTRRVAGTITQSGGIVYLNHQQRTFAATETVYLRCLKPAYYHCRTTAGSGTYGEKTDGLTAEANEVELPVEPVAAGAIVTALNRGYFLVDRQSDPLLDESIKRAARIFTDYCAAEDPRNYEDGQLTLRPARRYWGPTYVGYR
jgi:hypothetical protein